ncbi:MAG TPA: DUF2490 domain-containing protein [Pyrinomonadaceae bacterium]|nr:DUF2490 domain-containing protein [Pyrinomonadaceae bacterium]
MKKQLLLQLLTMFVLATCASAQLVDRTDNQVWSDVQVAVPVTKQFDFNVLGTLRLGRDINRPVDERVGVGFTFKAGKYFTASPNYLHIGMQPFRGRKIWENRLTFPVTLRFNVDKFRLSDRNQIERRIRNSGVRSTRYRNRFLIERPIGDSKWGLSFIIGDEVFYDWTVNRWVRNRFVVGVSKVFNKHFTEEFFYLRQNDGVSIPGDLNVIGTTLRFRL